MIWMKCRTPIKSEFVALESRKHKLKNANGGLHLLLNVFIITISKLNMTC